MNSEQKKPTLPIRAIRKDVLGVTQKEMSDIAGVSQTTVSRWEIGTQSPTLHEAQRIREFAMSTGLPWNDSWLFDGVDLSKAKRTKKGRGQ